MTTHYSITVYGKVQGVFFRDSTKRMADSLGIAGHVRNHPDGTVIIEAEGPDAAMEQLLEWCHVGPEAARVTKVEKEEKTPQGLEGFNVKG